MIISYTLWGLVAGDPTAARCLNPMDLDDVRVLALNPHLVAQRRRELAELAASRGANQVLQTLLAAQTGVPDRELARIVRASLKRSPTGRRNLAESVGRNAALFPTPNLDDDPEWWSIVPSSYKQLKAGDGPAWEELPPQTMNETLWMTALSYTVNEPGHPWHASDSFVITALSNIDESRATAVMTETQARRLLRRPAVAEWVLDQALRRSPLTPLVKQLTGSLLLSPGVPRNVERRRQLLLAAADTVGISQAAINPLVSEEDLKAVSAEEPGQLQARQQPLLADAPLGPSDLTEEHLAQLQVYWGKGSSCFLEWALAAEAESPIIPWVLLHQGLGPVANLIGVHAASQLVDKLAVTHPDEAARHRQRMADQGWAHPLRTSLSPAEVWVWARATPAEDPLSVRVGDLHATAQPRTTVRLPDEVSGLLDTPEAWERLARVAEQYPDQPLGAALLLARDTVAAA